jgi:hypothetical protein
VCKSCKCEYRTAQDYRPGEGESASKPSLVVCRYDGSSRVYPDTFTMPIKVTEGQKRSQQGSSNLGFYMQGGRGGGAGKTGGIGAYAEGVAGSNVGIDLAKGTVFDIYVGTAGKTGSGVAMDGSVAAGGRGGGGKATGGGSGGGGATWVTLHDATTYDDILFLAGGGGGAGADASASATTTKAAWGGRGDGQCVETATAMEDCENRNMVGYGDMTKTPPKLDTYPASAGSVLGAEGKSGGGGGGAGWAKSTPGGGLGGGSGFSGGSGGKEKRNYGYDLRGFELTTTPADGNGAA